MNHLKTPPTGLAILLIVGPSLVWCSEFIGSGEVILATRTGAILGSSVLWAVVSGVFLKFWIGLSGARYTVATGEGMIDMISRVPGPRNWGVWIVMIAQFFGAVIAIGSLANAAGVFLSNLLLVNPKICGWGVAIFALSVSWSDEFRIFLYYKHDNCVYSWIKARCSCKSRSDHRWPPSDSPAGIMGFYRAVYCTETSIQ